MRITAKHTILVSFTKYKIIDCWKFNCNVTDVNVLFFIIALEDTANKIHQKYGILTVKDMITNIKSLVDLKLNMKEVASDFNDHTWDILKIRFKSEEFEIFKVFIVYKMKHCTKIYTLFFNYLIINKILCYYI